VRGHVADGLSPATRSGSAWLDPSGGNPPLAWTRPADAAA
jgi:hypothetical protein